MRWLKRERWKVSIALAGMLLLLVVTVWVPVLAAGASEGVSGLATTITGTVQATPTEDATVTALNKEKLEQEVKQLKNQNAPDPLGWLRTNASILLSTLVVVIGALFGFWRWRVDRRAEREKQTEDRFQKAVEGLGSERSETQVGAAIMLRTFLQPGYERFYRQTFDLAVAHLRLRKAEPSAPEPSSSPAPVLIVPKGSLRQEQQPPPTASIPLNSLSQALITMFKVSFPLARNELKKNNAQFDPQQLDASNVRLDNAYLVAADLAEAWLVQASLCEANLGRAHLEGTNLYGAQLKGARLSGAHLEGANLSQAHLEEADLRWVHLEGANLGQAHLEEADLGLAQLKGTYLVGGQLKGANLSGAHLEGVDLSMAQLEGAHLSGADLKGVYLRWAQLKGANLYGAQLEGAHLGQAQLKGVDLGQAQLKGAHLYGAQLEGAHLKGANPEEADSLKDTKMNGVIGLTPEQLEKCIKKGAIFDDVEQIPASATSSSSSLSLAQSNDAQAPSAPSTQVNTPSPDTYGNGAASSQQGPAL
jgi:uncharacterized protein YjbI with pentapeptide repeats